jgi:drug/metabolite transporter (DMT)-like permease
MFLAGLDGILLALMSACFYGSGDFLGGQATRRLNAYQVLALASLSGLVLMAGLTWYFHEPVPSAESLFWAGIAGVCGSLGLTVLFYGLATRGSAIVSPVSGVVGALLPVLYTVLNSGLPENTQILGFAVAAPGIWLVTASSSADRRTARSGLGLGVLAGVGFGMFFILIARVGNEALFSPLAFLKIVAFLLALALLLIEHRLRRVQIPALRSNPRSGLTALLSGLLDPTANAFYLAATRLARLDVVVVITSLYPAFTVLLARLVTKEQISWKQWVGIGLCLAAIALISI